MHRLAVLVPFAFNGRRHAYVFAALGVALPVVLGFKLRAVFVQQRLQVRSERPFTCSFVCISISRA